MVKDDPTIRNSLDGYFILGSSRYLCDDACFLLALCFVLLDC